MGRVSEFTPEEKRDIVLEVLSGTRKMAEICREHKISNTAVYRWRDQFLEAGLQGLQGDGVSSREKAFEREVRELKELVGDLSVANYALRKASQGNRRGRR